MIMNKIILVPRARVRCLVLGLAALALLALQIPVRVFAATTQDGKGEDLRVFLNKTLKSRSARVGDTFTATVVDGGYLNGAKIFGHIESIRQSDRFEGATEMYLSFDSLTSRTGESYPISADIVRLYDKRSGDHVDAEGAIETRERGPQTLKRTGIGALTGGIFGGSAAALEADAGTMKSTARHKELVLDQGVEMLIRVYFR